MGFFSAVQVVSTSNMPTSPKRKTCQRPGPSFGIEEFRKQGENEFALLKNATHHVVRQLKPRSMFSKTKPVVFKHFFH